jgi:uncharacterized protein YfdQ (DUF2303 family)
MNNFVKNLVQPNDLDDMVNFNECKQKMIIERINQKFTELQITDDGLLKDVKESVATKSVRDAQKLQKQEDLKAQMTQNDLNSLKEKLEAVRGQVSAKISSIKDLKVQTFFNTNSYSFRLRLDS